MTEDFTALRHYLADRMLAESVACGAMVLSLSRIEADRAAGRRVRARRVRAVRRDVDALQASMLVTRGVLHQLQAVEQQQAGDPASAAPAGT